MQQTTKGGELGDRSGENTFQKFSGKPSVNIHVEDQKDGMIILKLI
jgi:hypothetical protein